MGKSEVKVQQKYSIVDCTETIGLLLFAIFSINTATAQIPSMDIPSPIPGTLSSILKERIDLEQKPGERNADTLNRILKEKTDIIKGLREEIERLNNLIQTNEVSLE